MKEKKIEKGITRIVITGTDTDVGKTVLSSMMVLALKGEYWKPIQSGLHGETDTDVVCRITGIDRKRCHREAYAFTAPLSPDQAAKREGRVVDATRLFPPETEAPLVIEGVGGAMVPLNDDLLQIDLFARWQIPVLLATRSSLGTLNHTFLSLEALTSRNIPVLGMIVIGESNPENIATLSHWADVPILGTMPMLESVNRESLLNVYHQHVTPIEEWI